MREFIRHPVDIPIQVRCQSQLTRAAPHIVNVSLGGLAFECEDQFSSGAIVEVVIPFVDPMFKTPARVVWCGTRDDHFEIGVQFLETDDAYRARMVEQVCYIETYKQTVFKTEGRTLTGEEAATEWIGQYAAGFPHPEGR